MLSRRKTTKQYRDSFLDVSPEIPQLEEEHGFLQSFGGDNGGIDKSPARFFSAPKRHSTWDDFKSSLSSRRTPRKANSTNVFPSYAAPGSPSEVAPQKLVSGRKRSTSNSFSRRASSIPTSSSTGHRSSSIFSSSFTPSTATGQTSLSSASASVENQYENRTERMEDGATSISPSKSDHTISLASYSRTMSAPSPTPILHPYASTGRSSTGVGSTPTFLQRTRSFFSSPHPSQKHTPSTSNSPPLALPLPPRPSLQTVHRPSSAASAARNPNSAMRPSTSSSDTGTATALATPVAMGHQKSQSLDFKFDLVVPRVVLPTPTMEDLLREAEEKDLKVKGKDREREKGKGKMIEDNRNEELVREKEKTRRKEKRSSRSLEPPTLPPTMPLPKPPKRSSSTRSLNHSGSTSESSLTPTPTATPTPAPTPPSASERPANPTPSGRSRQLSTEDTIGPSPIRAHARQLSSEEIAPSPIRPSWPEPDRSRQWKGVDEPGSSPSPPRPVRAEGRNHLRQWSAGDEVQLSRVHEPRTSNETAPLLPLRETSPTNLPASPPMISSYSSFSSTTHGPPRPKNDTKPLYMYRYTASPSASYTNTALTRHPSVPLFSPPPHAIASPPVRRRSSLASLPLATPSSSQGAESDYMSCSSTLSHNTPPRKTSIPESLGANGRQRIEDKVREAFRVPMAVKAKLLRSQRSVSASTLKKGGWDFLDVAETTPTTPTKEKVVGLGFEFDATAVGGKGRSVRSRSSLNDLGGRGMRDDTPQLSSVEKRQGLMRMNSDSNFQRRTPRLGDGGYELTGHVYRYASPRNSPRLT